MKILGSLLGGGSVSSGLGTQVVGDLLKGAMSGGRGSGGGLGDVLGSVLGAGRGSGAVPGSSGPGGGFGGVLGTVALAALAKYAAGQGGGGMPDPRALLAGGLRSGAGEPVAAGFDSPEANAEAQLLIEAMIHAAKSDGRIDDREEQSILERMGDLDPEEMDFLHQTVRAPVDADGFARRVPGHMSRQVYAASLLAMTLDERSEARYLRDLARGLGLDADTCNAIHAEMGAPGIFR